MHLPISSLTLCCLTPLACLSAQVQPTIEPGARVRVTQVCRQTYPGASMRPRTVCARNVGMLAEITGDSIVLTLNENGSRLGVPLDSIARVEVRQGRKSRTLIGAGIGAAAGGLSLALASTCSPGGDCGEGEWRLGLLVGTVAGAGIGALAGAFIKTDRWEEVPLSQLRVSLAVPRSGRWGVGLSLVF